MIPADTSETPDTKGYAKQRRVEPQHIIFRVNFAICSGIWRSRVRKNAVLGIIQAVHRNFNIANGPPRRTAPTKVRICVVDGAEAISQTGGIADGTPFVAATEGEG